MKVKINYNDARVRAKLTHIVHWLETYIGADLNRSLNSKILRSPEAFGDSTFARTIRDYLLIKTNPGFLPGKFSQQYCVNVKHLDQVRSRLGLPLTKLKPTGIERRFEQQADNIRTGEFDYNETGGRSYNGLQNIPREYKQEYWAERNYIYDYDIDTAAPVLLSQRAKQINPKMKQLEYINFFINNKILVREELSIKYNLSSKQVKQVLNGLFQGGRLNCYKDNKILELINNNTYTMKQLANDPFLVELVKDIAYMWQQIRPDIDTGFVWRDDQRRKRQITGKDKSAYYKQLEGQVMTPIYKYLKKNKYQVFKEHDGFRTQQFIAPEEIEQIVLFETGFSVKFSWNKCEVSDSDS